MMDWRVAIPSKGRAGTIVVKTLPLLLGRGIPSSRIDLWLLPDEQLAYKRAIADATLPMPCFRDAPPGMAAVRNAISQGYTEGSLLVQFDDDVRDVRRLIIGTKKLEPVADLAALLDTGFGYMLKAGATLWGPYPSSNPLSMKPGLDFGAGLVIGCMYGSVVKHAPEFIIDVPIKTDYRFTIAHLLHGGGIVRLRDTCVITSFRQPGGIGTERAASEQAAVDELIARFPRMLRAAPERKSGFAEMKFRR